MDVVEPARQAASVAVERPAAEPRVAGPPVPGHDPVVQRQPEERQTLVVGGDRRQPFERVAQVVAEEADEPAEEPRRVGRHHDGAVESRHQPARHGERVGPGGRPLEDRDRVGGEVGPAGVAARAGALEEGEPGQVAERLGHVDRPGRREAVREAPEPEWGTRPGTGDHGAMIRRDRRPAARIALVESMARAGRLRPAAS